MARKPKNDAKIDEPNSAEQMVQPGDTVLRPHVEVADSRLLLPRHLIAKAFAVGPDSVGKWDIKPVVQRGQERLYYLPEVIHYRGGSEGSVKLNPAQEKALLDKTRRESAQLELEYKRGNMVLLDDVARTWEHRLIILRQRLLALPNKLARPMVEVTTAQDAERLITKELLRILEDMNGDATRTSDGIEGEITLRTPDSQGPQSAAENDATGMGGHV